VHIDSELRHGTSPSVQTLDLSSCGAFVRTAPRCPSALSLALHRGAQRTPSSTPRSSASAPSARAAPGVGLRFPPQRLDVTSLQSSTSCWRERVLIEPRARSTSRPNSPPPVSSRPPTSPLPSASPARRGSGHKPRPRSTDPRGHDPKAGRRATTPQSAAARSQPQSAASPAPRPSTSRPCKSANKGEAYDAIRRVIERSASTPAHAIPGEQPSPSTSPPPPASSHASPSSPPPATPSPTAAPASSPSCRTTASPTAWSPAPRRGHRRLFPLWLRVLKDHPGAGQQEPPRPPRDPATPARRHPARRHPARRHPAPSRAAGTRHPTTPARENPPDTRLRRLRVRRRRADLSRLWSTSRPRAMQRLPVASRRGASFKLHSLPRTANIAQLVRALGCGPRGHGFESHYSPRFSAAILIDRVSCRDRRPPQPAAPPGSPCIGWRSPSRSPACCS
jgi:hypothetical protein